jgi:dATP pyrophosphohydrolase
MRPEIKMKNRAVSCFVLRHLEDEWQVLLLKRVGEPLDGEWCQVAGRLEDNETAWEAAVRELKEETGLKPERLYSADICEQFYVAHADAISIVPVFVAFVDRGQKVTLNEEHSQYKWMSLAEAELEMPFRSQRRTLRTVWSDFTEHKPSEHLRIEIPGN